MVIKFTLEYKYITKITTEAHATRNHYLKADLTSKVLLFDFGKSCLRMLNLQVELGAQQIVILAHRKTGMGQ